MAAVIPLAAAPAGAADPIDHWVTIDGPAAPLRVGDLFELTIEPHATDAAATHTTTYVVPSGVELVATTCDVEERTVTCSGAVADGAITLELVAAATGPVTHTATIAGTAPDPAPDPTPNSATTTTTAVASVKDVDLTINTFGGPAGQSQGLVLSLSKPSTATSDPPWAVGTVTVTLPASFVAESADFAAIELGQQFEHASCSVSGSTATCDIVGPLTFMGVFFVPTEAGSFTVAATYTAGPGQTESHPAPSSTTKTLTISPAPTTTSDISGTVHGTVAPTFEPDPLIPPNPLAGVQVDALAVGSDSATATASPS